MYKFSLFVKSLFIMGVMLLATPFLEPVNLVFYNSAFAQGTQASFHGIILDDSNEPVAGASVVIRNNSTGFTLATSANINGEYSFKQLPLGGPYTITASLIGFASVDKVGYFLNQGNTVRVDFVLKEESYQISTAYVVANSLRNDIGRLGQATSITPNEIHKLPVNGRNFRSLTDLSPLSMGNNLAGQLFSSTSFTIDGMTAKSPLSSGTSNRGPYLLSMEAIREFAVVTNDYDVTQGRAGGGAIHSVTKSGTNNFQGSAFVFHRADQLSSKYDSRGNRRTNKYQISQYGGSVSGPIKKDRAHFFLSWDHQIDTRPLYIADIQSKEDEIRYRISQENLDKFLSIARSQYGVSQSAQTGSFNKRRPSNSIFLRLDWQINPSNLLTFRNNFNHDLNDKGISDNTSINLYEVYGTHLTMDNSSLVTLRSVINPKLTNEAKVQYLYTKDDGRPNSQLPKSNIPRAIVQNIESVIDGKKYTTNIQLGGQRYLPETFINNVFQFVNNMYYTTDKAEYTFGVDVMYTHLNSKATSEMNGRFFYRGMDDFQNNRPYRFVREVPVQDPTVKQGVLSQSIYAQGKFKLYRGVELIAGIRSDYNHFISSPNDNALLNKELGLKTSNKVKSFLPQPRVQLTWDINDKHTDVIRIGGGLFASNINNYSMVNNLQFDGERIVAFDRSVSPGADLGIDANFVDYRNNPSSVPGAELFDKFNLPKVATYNINSKDVKVPVVYKWNVSYNRFFSDRLRVGAAFYATHTRNNYMYVDRNMVDNPFFRLANEGDRGVYVPASSISSRGTQDWTMGRKSDKIGRVLELVSEGKNDTYTFVLDGTWNYFADGMLNFSYTRNDAKDNTSYNGNVANSATLSQMVVDDPRDLSRMSYSNVQFRDKVVLFGNTPSFLGINIGVRFSGIGGTRYSMVVNGNINGDFVSGNDLAYVFDPNSPSTPADIKSGIEDLLSSHKVSSSFKSYLKSSFGKVAQRNGGKNPFSGVWDVRLTKDFKIYKNQKIELQLDVFNLANLIDKKRGFSKNLGTQSLYTIKGFNHTTNTFEYNVNPSAGVVFPGGDPWQLQIGVRYSF